MDLNSLPVVGVALCDVVEVGTSRSLAGQTLYLTVQRASVKRSVKGIAVRIVRPR